MDVWQDPVGRPSATAVRPVRDGRELEGGRTLTAAGCHTAAGAIRQQSACGSRAPLIPVIDFRFVGAWRSLVAHQSGGLVVVGSNPAAPTKIRS